jgi:serine/threonine-protein kinase
MRECPRCESCHEDAVESCPECGTATKPTLPCSTLLNDRYRLEKRLGRGAMGQVYLARDENLSTRRVAIKTVRPDILQDEDMQEGEAIARFEREARTAASIRHPNVVDVTDFGKSPEGIFYLVMEYVEGETLYHLLRREGTLNPQRTLDLIRQVCEGVEAAHEEKILHRDLKPANIFIMKKKSATMKGDGFVKVGDFGLAKIVDQAVAEIEAANGGPQSRGIIGTPEYMAPEQMQTGAQLDERADVYALGVVAYHMLGGRPPFTGDLAQLIMQKMMQTPAPLSSLRSDVPPAVEKAVMHALEREPEKRSRTVGEWLEEFEFAVSKVTTSTVGEGDARVTVMSQPGAEVYVDDQRKGIIGRSGRIILADVPPGRHVLRVSAVGLADDERVIEVGRGGEQIIQANLRVAASQPGSGIGVEPSMPSLVACTKCGARFASGAKFCGHCGNTVFRPVSGGSQPGVTPPSGIQQPPSGFNQPQPHYPRSLVGGAQPPPSYPAADASPSYPSGQPPTAATVRCQKCSTIYPASVRFCGKCGIPIQAAPAAAPPQPTAVRCPRCNTNYPPGTKFCGRCGTVIR